VVATRKSVDRERTYSSISGVMRMESGSFIVAEIALWNRNSFIISGFAGKAVRHRKDAQKKGREIARQRMEVLFQLAAAEHERHPERSDRYAQIARRISTRARVRIPPHLKRLFCKHCGRYLSPTGSRVRLRNGILTATCLGCGRQTRRPYKIQRTA
jgi:ribonuclease P protein subunit RPR2